jgi:hypothetical protein
VTNHSEGDEDADDDGPKLIGIIVVLVLAICGIVLINALRRESALEDCLMSGRTNCAPIEVPASRR